jgi:hypothetical protein
MINGACDWVVPLDTPSISTVAPNGSDSIEMDPVSLVNRAVIELSKFTFLNVKIGTGPTERPFTSTSSMRYPSSGMMAKDCEPSRMTSTSPEGAIEPPGPALAVMIKYPLAAAGPARIPAEMMSRTGSRAEVSFMSGMIRDDHGLSGRITRSLAPFAPFASSMRSPS